MTTLTISCTICMIQDLNSTADHRCETCGHDVCLTCANEGYDLDHKRIDEAEAPKAESETGYINEFGTAIQTTESWWETGTCNRGHGRKVHAARISYGMKDGKKGTRMIVPFCAMDTRVSTVQARNAKSAGVQEIDCMTCKKIGASFNPPFTG